MQENTEISETKTQKKALSKLLVCLQCPKKQNILFYNDGTKTIADWVPDCGCISGSKEGWELEAESCTFDFEYSIAEDDGVATKDRIKEFIEQGKGYFVNGRFCGTCVTTCEDLVFTHILSRLDLYERTKMFEKEQVIEFVKNKSKENLERCFNG